MSSTHNSDTHVFPSAPKDIPHTIHLKCFHSSSILHIQSPRFTTIQQTRFNYPLIHSNFCFSTNMPLLPDIFQSSPCSPCLSYSVIHLYTHSTVIRNINPPGTYEAFRIQGAQTPNFSKLSYVQQCVPQTFLYPGEEHLSLRSDSKMVENPIVCRYLFRGMSPPARVTHQ